MSTVLKQQNEVTKYHKWLGLLTLFILISISPIYGATITWTNGGGDNLWSNTANWSSGTLPTSSDDVVFDGTSVANATLDLTTSIRKFTIDVAYTGQVNLGNQALTLSSNLTIDNATQLNAGTSTVIFTGTVTVNCPANLYNLTINAPVYNNTIHIAENLTVNDTLLLTAVNSMYGDTLKVHGNIISNTNASHTNYIKLVGSTDQTIAGSGSLRYISVEKTGGDVLIPNDFTFTVGGLRGSGYINTGGFLNISGSFAFNYTGTIDDLSISSGVYNNSINLTENLTVNDTLLLTAVNSMYGDTLKVHGNIISNTNASHTNYIKLVGSTDQTIAGSGSLRYISVEKTGGDVLIPNDFTFTVGGLRGSGYINTGGFLNISGSFAFNYTGTIDDLSISSGVYNNSINLTENLTVNDTLLLTAVNSMYGDTLKVHGNIISNTNASHTNYIKLVGSTDQTIAGSGSLRYISVEKTGGDVLIPNDFTFTVGGLRGSGYINTGGFLNISGSFAFNYTGTIDDLSISSGVYNNSINLTENLTVNDTLLLTAVNSMYGDTLKVHGNIISNTNASHTNYIKLVGSTDQTIAGSGSLRYISVEKTGGDVLIPNDFTFTVGGLRGSGYINTGGFLNISGSFAFNYTGTIDDLSISSGVYNNSINLTENLTVNDTLLLTAVNSMYGDTLKVHGNIISNTNASHTNYIKLVGSTDQTIAGSGSLRYISVEKTGGDVLIPNDFTFTVGGLRGSGYINTGGFLNISGSFAFNYTGTIDDLSISSGVYNNSINLTENLTVNDTLLLTAVNSMYGDTLKVHGNIISNTNANHSNYIKLVGTTDQTLAGTGRLKNFSLEKPNGNLLFDASYGKAFTTFRVDGYEWDLNNDTITATNFYIGDGATIKGIGTLTGNLTVENGGSLSLGSSPGCIAVSGNYILQSGGTHVAEIGGETACTDYDQLQVSGAASLAGDLEIELLNGFVPTSANNFDIISSASRSGTFGTITPPVDYNGNATYNANGVVLGVVSTAVLIEIGTDSVCIGEDITLPVNIGNGDGVGSFSIRLDFDNTELQFTGNSNIHTGLNNGNLQVTDPATANANGYITMAWIDGANINGTAFGDSKLLDLGFTTLASGTSNLTWNTTGSNGDITDGLGSALGLISKDSIAFAFALPTPTIVANDTSVCLGETVTFTAGGGVSYEFFVNGTSQGATSSTATFVTNTLINGDEVDVYVTNANGCIDSSSVITMSIFDLPTAGLTSDDADDSICIGDAVTFTATGGVSYEFQINGITVQANSVTDTYTTSTLADGDAATVIVTNANSCVTTSSAITTTVNPLPTADLTSSDVDNTICIGDAVTFTGTGGISYEFQLNGTTVQANSATATYTTSTLADGDAVTVLVTNTNGCIDTSSAITTTVNPLPTAGLTSDDVDNAICLNDAVTFTGTGGVSYEFKINGTTVQANSATATYTTSVLADGDAVTVVVTNANGCIATSSGITMTVRPLPVVQTVTGGGDYCPSGSASVIGLASSEVDVSYQLVFNGSVIETITGTGSAINFTGVTTTNPSGDTYTVEAFNSVNTDCTSDMSGSATVTLTCFDVTTNLIYDNGNNQGLKNTSVILYDNTGAQAGTGTTDNSGSVTFMNVNNGTGYYVAADLSSKPFDGVNGTDALLIMLDFSSHITLTGLKAAAADVDNSGTSNASDALETLKRYVGNTHNFSGDWLHDTEAGNGFDVNGADITETVLVLTIGDVNGSYDVSGLNNGTKSIINTFNEGELHLEEGTTIDIPFYTKQSIEAGAVSLVVNFPYDVFDVEKVTLNKAIDNVIYEIKDGRIRLSWFSLQPIQLDLNEALFTITAKVHEDLTAAWTPTITFGNESELADGQGQVINQINLTVPTILLPQQNVLNFSNTFQQTIYPNPAQFQTNLEYNLPTDAQVTVALYDGVGREVAILSNETQSKGIYTLMIDTDQMASGLYTIRTLIKTTTGIETYTEQLIISK